MDLFNVIEELGVFKQKLIVKLRSHHCLIVDADCFNEDIVMGLLHHERSTISTLEDIIKKFESLSNEETNS